MSDAASANGSAPDEGYTGTGQAARALAVSARTVRRLYDAGELEGRMVKRGRSSKVLEVSISSLKMLRDKRIAEGLLNKDEAVDFDEAVTTSSDETAALARAFENMGTRLQETAAEAAEYRIRLEITERAQSTQDAELREERERREAAEREAERLRAELEAERRNARQPRRPKGLIARLLGG